MLDPANRLLSPKTIRTNEGVIQFRMPKVVGIDAKLLLQVIKCSVGSLYKGAAVSADPLVGTKISLEEHAEVVNDGRAGVVPTWFGATTSRGKLVLPALHISHPHEPICRPSSIHAF